MKYALIFLGAILGGLFINDKMEPIKHDENKTEIVMGHRVTAHGDFVLVTR